MRLVYMQRFINELLAYISGTLAMAPLPLALPDAAMVYLKEQQIIEEARIRGQRMRQGAGLGIMQEADYPLVGYISWCILKPPQATTFISLVGCPLLRYHTGCCHRT